jgi:hypothetical protein
MAVATWQKSTARRFVSTSSVLQITNKILFGLAADVTSRTLRRHSLYCRSK